MIRSTVHALLAATVLSVVAEPLLASNLRLLDHSPGRFFTEQDWQNATAAGRKTLNDAKDGETVVWDNPKSGHFGSMTPVSTTIKNGAACRLVKIESTAGGTTGGALYEFCQSPDGKWTAVEGESELPAAPGGIQGPSVMSRQQNDYDRLTSMPEGQGGDLGEKCQAMIREIDGLKGKPQRRSVLMERFQAECQR